MQLGVAYSLKKQIFIFVPYELYFKQKWKLNGEVGYYRYFYNYYHIGIISNQSDLESYDANFPRFLSTLSYRLKPPLLVGIQYRFDHFEIPRTDSLLQLEQPVGINGGTISSLGIAITYDNRDDIFYPGKGFLTTLVAENRGKYTGASFSYTLLQLDIGHYVIIKEKHTIVPNFYTGTTAGKLPFFTYYYLSSGKKGRGYNDRRFIDRNIRVLQLEYRFPIYKRFRETAFSSVGTVANRYTTIFAKSLKFLYSVGLSFQLSKKQMSHLRFDIARGNEGMQFYITIGEAF